MSRPEMSLANDHMNDNANNDGVSNNADEAVRKYA